jgi:glyceraldehyde-3-phosphate dehydrogenase type I
MRVAINGFGRIGRMVFRAYLQKLSRGEKLPFEIIAINDLGDPKQTAHLLQYDTNYGTWPEKVVGEDGKLSVGDKSFTLVRNRNPEELPWGELKIDLVIECTGVFRNREGASKHIKGGAKRVMISAPGKGDIDATFVMGVNHTDYDPEKHFIVSNASCTTNCLGPITKVLNDAFGIKRGMITTIHGYTNDQNIHDNDHRDWRRARAATQNIIPTSTGAAKAIGQVIPELQGKMDGLAVRVPVSVVSITDLTAELNQDVTVDQVNAAMKAAADGPLKGILGYSEEPLVSTDYKGEIRSSVYDAPLTKVMDGNMVKIMAWYDNEWGYSIRCLDLAAYMATRE